jgi:hypothetical protein
MHPSFRRGKDASFLQVYHHTGIAIAMFFGCTYECNWLIWVVALNSFIHTLMCVREQKKSRP